MKIMKIKTENFKSYKKFELDLNNLNFIIGGNASGKSNFVNLLKFLNDLIDYGLDDAILLQGGIKYMFNANTNKNSSIFMSYDISLENEKERIFMLWKDIIDKQIYLPKQIKYSLKIKPNMKGESYRVNNEVIEIDFDGIINQKNKMQIVDNIKVIISKDSNGKITDNLNREIFSDSEELLSINRIIRLIQRDSGLLLNNFLSSYGIFYRYENKIKIYNFDVNLLKSPSNIIARAELEENGSNLVNIIQQLLKNKFKKERLNKILKMILPFVEDIEVENNVNKSLFFKVKESYNKSEFPSYMLSDGTVNILAVIVALYFQSDNEIIILEEPERNIHPKLLSMLVTILEEVSSKKQIFVTTHNPYIIKEAKLNDIILVSRDEKGISKISKPINDKKVKLFLENDLGIEDLFISGILK